MRGLPDRLMPGHNHPSKLVEVQDYPKSPASYTMAIAGARRFFDLTRAQEKCMSAFTLR